jgi:hypothetical protein
MATIPQNLTSSQLGTELELEYAESEVGLRLEDGRSERILLKTACPTRFVVHEPTVAEDGGTHMGLEILKFELVGKSEILWPGQTVRVLGGADSAPGARPIVGSVHLEAGKSLEDGARSEQVLYLTVESPLGVLHNEKPVRMTGNVYRIPPVGSRFQSTDEVPMLDVQGIARVTFWACSNES